MDKTIINKRKLFCKQNIPNFLTIIRICCFPIIVAFLIVNVYQQTIFYELNNPLSTKDKYTSITTYHFIAGIIFIFASLTDFVDGWVARKFHYESTFGKLWDPIADKLIVNSVIIMFALQKLIPIYIPIIMIARDIIVDAYKMYAASKNVVIAANFFGKAKTVTQMLAIIFVFFIFCHRSEALVDSQIFVYYAIQNLMFYLATLISIISLFVYIYEIKKKLIVKK